MAGRRSALLGLLALAGMQRAPAQARELGLAEAARLVTLYLLPGYLLYARRWHDTVDDSNPGRLQLNRLMHEALPAGAASAPDTLAARAWIDLGHEPLFFEPPPIGQRHWCFTLIDMTGTPFAAISRRLHGAAAPPHMIVAPAWDGHAPRGMVVLRSPTTTLLMVGQIEALEREDPDALRALQGRLRLETPDMRNERRILEIRELMRQSTMLPPEPVAEWPAPQQSDPVDILRVGAQLMAESPAPWLDGDLQAAFELLRLRPGRRFDWRGLPASSRDSILAGIAEAWALAGTSRDRFTRRSNFWHWLAAAPVDRRERLIYNAVRATVTPEAPLPADMIVATCRLDSAGRPLSGLSRYRLHLAAGPPALGFWSLSAHPVAADGSRTAGASAAAALRDRTGLHRRADGSVEIRLALNHSRDNTHANWLATPASSMEIEWRLYEPSPDLLSGQMALPAVERV